MKYLKSIHHIILKNHYLTKTPTLTYDMEIVSVSKTTMIWLMLINIMYSKMELMVVIVFILSYQNLQMLNYVINKELKVP